MVHDLWQKSSQLALWENVAVGVYLRNNSVGLVVQGILVDMFLYQHLSWLQLPGWARWQSQPPAWSKLPAAALDREWVFE